MTIASFSLAGRLPNQPELESSYKPNSFGVGVGLFAHSVAGLSVPEASDCITCSQRRAAPRHNGRLAR